MYKNERCLIFDESGNLGQSGRYFVIACIDTAECKSLHNIMKRKLQTARNIFPELGLNHAHEIKASEAHPCVKHHILECIVKKDVKISYIVAGLEHTETRLLEDKNILYNFLMKLLIERIITHRDKGMKINILCDNKTTKVTSRDSFQDYIKLYLNYERRLDLDLNISYMDSDSGNAFIIQAVDYVANAIYSHYEYGNSIYKDILSCKTNIIQEFPWKTFGK